jgi:hypothetical protein
MLTAALPLAPLHSAATDRRVLLAAPRRDRRRRIAPLQSALLSGHGRSCGSASVREGNRVPKDFSLRHVSLEHKENTRASRYILCTALQEAQLPFLPHRQAALDYRPPVRAAPSPWRRDASALRRNIETGPGTAILPYRGPRCDTNYRRPRRPVSNQVDTDDRGKACWKRPA